MPSTSANDLDYDYVVIGSGFGGSVAALRLAEKGYRVLVLEKGRWKTADDFPKTIWNLRRWLWLPALRFFGHFKLTYLRHVTILSGIGVGGGSLGYANTLPLPKKPFFESPNWAHLGDWETELGPYYKIARSMLGAQATPVLGEGDRALHALATEIGKAECFDASCVAVFFGEPGVTVPDPYFDGRGPERAGCTLCGGCMVGCRFNAKNTLDKNYLHLAQGLGATIQAESTVFSVVPVSGGSTTQGDDARGYHVRWQSPHRLRKRTGSATVRGVVFSAGVLGTVDLLLRLKVSSLPNLSDRVGAGIRTNSESIVPVTTYDRKRNFSDGVAIGSILQTDDHSHLEPVRYSSGSGFWRLMVGPLVDGRSMAVRFARLLVDLIRHPIQNLRVATVGDWARNTSVLLYMRSTEGTLALKRGRFGLRSTLEEGRPPDALVPEAHALARGYAKIVNGKPTAFLHESIFGIPTTAHILGGAVMGKDRDEGVIDRDHRVFGYPNMFVCDGSAVSANPGVNPSLTITALSERAMSKIPVNADSQ